MDKQAPGAAGDVEHIAGSAIERRADWTSTPAEIRAAAIEEVASWYACAGWLLDEDDVPAAIRRLATASTEPAAVRASLVGQQGTLSLARIVRNAIFSNSHPCDGGWLMFASEDEVDTVCAQVERAAASASPVPRELSDPEIVAVLASLGTDADKSIYPDNPVLQVHTTVPGIRQIVAAYIKAAAQGDESETSRGAAQGRITQATRDQIIEASGNAILAGEKPGTIEYDVALVRNLAATSASASPAAAVAAPAPAPVAGSQHVPEGRTASQAIERIFQSWDGCKYDNINIGEALREDFAEVPGFPDFAAAAPAVPVPAEQGWISVDDHLPPENELVAVLFWPYNNRENAQTVSAASCIDGVFYTHEGEGHHPPSHWAPLPAAPSLQQPKTGA